MKNHEYGLFPMFVDLSDKKVVVVGAGKIAARRILTLLEFASDITVVADRVEKQIQRLAQEQKIILCKRSYLREDLYGADLVIAATDDENLNHEIYSVCQCLGILVNVISDKSKCDFHFPGIVKREHLVIGINAGGKNHRLVKDIRKQIEKMMEGSNDDWA